MTILFVNLFAAEIVVHDGGHGTTAAPRTPRPCSGSCWISAERRSPRHFASARWRKAAIWPRETFAVGQNVVGVQPLGLPDWASLLMSLANVLPLSSVNQSLVAGLRSRARTRKAAIWPRVTLAVGQNFVALQPLVMPDCRSALMSFSKVVPLSSLNQFVPDGGRLSPRTRNAAI